MPFYIGKNKIYTNKTLQTNNSINKNIIPNHINISTTNRLFGKTPSVSMPIYSSQDPYYNGIGKFIRNPNCWINGLSNISCFSPAQMSGANWWQRGGTLLTKKHALFAKHFITSIISGGTPLIFVDENNNVIRRNIINYAYSNDASDIAIALLDNDVPNNIKIAKVLPKNFDNYINLSNLLQYNGYRSVTFSPLLYSIALDQSENAVLRLLTNANLSIASYDGGQTNTVSVITQNDVISSAWVNTPRVQFPLNNKKSPNPDPIIFKNWSKDTIVGDSGNPAFIIIDNELVVLSAFLHPTGGPFVSDPIYYDIINNFIESLSPGEGYSLTPVDLMEVYNKYK